MDGTAAVIAVGIVVLATVAIGISGLRFTTTPDFFVASRSVSPWLNASAISGEYLSAASFLGIAGLVFAYGLDMLWYAVGYTAGYLVMLTLVAAPLRRSGAYTVADFAESRLESRRVRGIASLVTVAIGWLYLAPQMQGAGLALSTGTGVPMWVGAVVVGLVVVGNVMAGGMRSVTFVQAFQFWLKLAAIVIPVLFLLLAWHAAGTPSPIGPTPPTFPERTTVTIQTPITARFTQPVVVAAHGTVDGAQENTAALRLSPGSHQIGAKTQLVFPKGADVPSPASMPMLSGQTWVTPLSDGLGNHALYVVYSLIVATFLGVMGLPHVIVRFYTNPDGRTARRTTIRVLGLLGVFYLLPPIYGALARLYTPELLLTGRTDAVVLLLPGRLVGGLGGELLSALLMGGAFAAFLSTSSGLTVSIAGVISQNVLRHMGVAGFRLAAGVAVAIPLVAALLGPRQSVADVVGLAFAVAASSLCPLVVLGIWWPKLTSTGATAGMIAGGGLAVLAGALSLSWTGWHGWAEDLLNWPAAWTVPVGFAVMIGVSLATPGKIAPDVAKILARLHTPEARESQFVKKG